MYLFDTDTLSNVVKRKPIEFLKNKLAALPKESQYTSSITLGEIYYGANKTDRKEQILSAFEEKVFPNVNVLPFDEKSAKIFGQLKAKLEKKGTGCSEPDLRIASIAIQHKLTLITGNTKHFKNIPGLKTENWLMIKQ
ncbi:MAG: PIN domain-containing protein [Candidatus Aminicenantes bacterium]|nr:PIN domain-containing protein [Candidatus Aminicenantes bacterium]NIM78100.1 PIN domain-containing protein [Candidatus Aminicenantes bacterium]NIN17418.1 PIN domain-containing protein [Candidatus Aminicenantes bacterium]NIN41314.1 PIN domain-containing protein [Candidatus Aminicenantes bacterium]NIN84084.1 PIN domain-containing protein [Candidatus Aminicenantes bacterium]